MIKDLSRVYSPIIKKFLLKKFGVEAINGFTIIDSQKIGFIIRQMKFFIDCKTMSVHRQVSISNDLHDIFVFSSIDDECVNLIEKNLKLYVNAEIENMEKS